MTQSSGVQARKKNGKSAKPRGRRRNSRYAIFVLLLSCILFLSGGIRIHKSSPAHRAEIAANVEALSMLENRQTVDLDAVANEKYMNKLRERGGVLVDDLPAEQDRIMNLSEWSKGDFARWFSDAAILGDSITEAAASYGWLSKPPVYAKIGISVSGKMELLDDVEAAQPKVIFLCFGMNDVEHYKSRVDVFIERYRDCLSRLKSSLPNAVIYVNAVFPVSEKKLAKQSVFQYVDLYNQGLEQLCREMDVFYIDSGFILRRNPDYFDQDGQHPISRFYPLWLTYFADIAGLSNDDE